MKRQQDRDTMSKGKRPRPAYDEYDEYDRRSPDMDRRDDRPKHVMPRDRHREMSSREYDHPLSDYDRMPPKRHRPPVDDPFINAARQGPGMGPEYRTLCISGLNPRVHDNAIRDKLYFEFKKYGDFNVKVVHNGDQRIAYVNFKYPEDARDAKQALYGELNLFDSPVRIDSVYNKRDGRPRSASPGGYGGSSSGEGGPDMFSNRSLSPPRRSLSGGRRPVGRDMSDMPPRDRGDYRGGFDNNQMRGRPQEHQRREPKFPHHLNHIDPEDDDKATRTLFVGNLDYNITDPELRDVFEKFGFVEDIDIKRPHHGQGNAYAFIRFYNLDIAHRAKVDLSGQLIGKFQCKIGYGKPTPSTALWIGGLGPWVTIETLEREFDRFGVVRRIHWPQDKNYAFVLFDSIDAAQAACQGMRGFPVGGPNRRLRIDFADVEHMNNPPPEIPVPRTTHSAPPDRDGGGRNLDSWQQNRDGGMRGGRNDWQRTRNDSYRSEDNMRDRPGRGSFDGGSNGQDRRRSDVGRNFEDGYRTQSRDRFPRGHDDGERNFSPQNRPRRVSPGCNSMSSPYDPINPDDHADRNRDGQMFSGMGNLEKSETVSDMAKSLPVVWSGALVLKASAFAARMHLVSGDVHLVDTLMRDHTTTEMPVLKITQRLRLDQPKLDEVGRRVSSSGPNGHSVLLAMPGNAPVDDPNSSVQQRPLKNLVSYLKQKEAAGVIALPPNQAKEQETGVLHAFPPCQFGQDFLQKRAPRLHGDLSKDDHLVVIVYRGTA